MLSQFSLAVGLLFALLHPQLVLSNPAPAEITLGPQGYASFASMESFSTLKPCAQGCLRYNGVYVCGMAGYGDLGSHIGCSCSPQNYCFCDKREAAAASSYIQSCIVTKCKTPNEESAALDLYNGYCLTANVAVSSSTTKPYSFTGATASTPNPSTISNSGSSSRTAAPVAATSTGNAASSNTASSSTEEKKPPALGLGAIIGIAVGGIVLLGALLCLGCCMIWRKRRSSKKAKQAAITAAYTNQQPLENAYVPPADGATQLDGTGVFTKPTPNEKVTYVNPHTGAAAVANVSPISTPGTTFAQPTPSATPTPNPNTQPYPTQYPTQGYTNTGTPHPHPNAHEVYGNQTYPHQTMAQLPANEVNFPPHQQQYQQQQHVHEMYGNNSGVGNAYQRPPQQGGGNVYEKP